MHPLIESIRDLIHRVQHGGLRRSSRLWYGADVAVSRRPPRPPRPDDFYGNTDIVVTTPHAGELSWLIVQIKGVFYGHAWPLGQYDKERLFGRLADAANRHIQSLGPAPHSAESLAIAVLAEAHQIATEVAEFEEERLGQQYWEREPYRELLRRS